MRIDPCALCGTPKSIRESGDGRPACPHCDRVSCVQSTCLKQPCVTYEGERQSKLG